MRGALDYGAVHNGALERGGEGRQGLLQGPWGAAPMDPTEPHGIPWDRLPQVWMDGWGVPRCPIVSHCVPRQPNGDVRPLQPRGACSATRCMGWNGCNAVHPCGAQRCAAAQNRNPSGGGGGSRRGVPSPHSPSFERIGVITRRQFGLSLEAPGGPAYALRWVRRPVLRQAGHA